MAGTLKTEIILSFQNKFKVRCMTLLIEAYNVSISKKTIELDFDENDISSILHYYITGNPKRKTWKIHTNTENFIFDISKPLKKGFASKQARIDMRFAGFWQNEEFTYYCEAKNLHSNDSSLKRRYINTGINNFLGGGKYVNCDGFLVGYVLEGTLESNINGINDMIKKDNKEIEKITNSNTFINNHQIYISAHPQRTLNHIFLNFTNA